MKKKIICALLAGVMLLGTACQSDDKPNDDLQKEIATVLQGASYDNLEILFEDINFYDGQELVEATIDWYNDIEYTISKETMELYAEVVFPDLMGVDELDKNFIWDLESKSEDGESYTKNYEQVLATIDEYDTLPCLVYKDVNNCASIYAPMNWYSGVYSSQGVIGKIANSTSAFAPKRIVVDEKMYDCRLDDLSDSYVLMDGEKTVAQAKAEMEAYFNEHYPIADRDNGITHEIYQIAVGKIEGTEYYAFHGYRTFVYKGIPFTEARSNNGLGKYFVVMGESYMCESNKVDVTMGVVNGYTEPEVTRTLEELLSFQEVLDRVAYYLTGETKFQLVYGGLEYRLVMNSDDYVKVMTPSWVFVAKNPNDEKAIKIYVDMETGEIHSSSYE